MGKGIGNAREYESVAHWLHKHNEVLWNWCTFDGSKIEQLGIYDEENFGYVCDTLRESRYTYVTATGSDDMISRIFSQPNVVMYAIE